MKKRKWLFALGMVAVAGAGAAFIYVFLNASPWPRAYSRIALGMTEQEVETAIGFPPGYYEGQHPTVPSMSRILSTPPLRQAGIAYGSPRADGHKSEHWIGRDYVIWVIFDAQGVAIGAYLFEYLDDSDEPSVIQWFLGLVGR